MTEPVTQAEYKVDQFFAGWGGGFGKSDAIAARLNEQARLGWRLISTKTAISFWMWFLPRHRVLLIYERRA